MLVCGLKLTHDGGVALIDGDRLVLSVELEKLANHPRHRRMEDLDEVAQVLADFGYATGQVDLFVVDGWEGLESASVRVRAAGRPIALPVAPYRERTLHQDLLEPREYAGLPLEGRPCRYRSYPHAAGHVVGSFAASPFAVRGESAHVLVWDGGMYPRLYHVDPAARRVRNLGHLFPFIGHIYTIFAQHFGPFRCDVVNEDDLTLAGKVMAYIALGKAREELIEVCRETYREQFEASMRFAGRFARAVERRARAEGHADEDVLASFHAFLERLLVDSLRERAQRLPPGAPRNMCLTGGCALNIKWNTAIRDGSGFDHVFVPPFPNDSGSALGAACCARFADPDFRLRWDPFRGPALGPAAALPGWRARPCSLRELAQHLHERDAPVVFLSGRAELGPRALGARSILAPPTAPDMKARLNAIKRRESYRPVAPVCLEERAPALFDPGRPDPYMLFDHRVRPAWRERIAAIVHLDGTARLQTVRNRQPPELATLLREYERLSGVPVLCNTSANRPGAGFFPDAASAMRWGEVDAVYCKGTLFERTAPRARTIEVAL